MNLNDMLRGKGIDPRRVLVLRHRPHEPQLNRVLPWLAGERPDLFNAYQQTQGERLERVMQAMIGSGYVASFIGRQPGKALFVGLYTITASRLMGYEDYWRLPANQELKTYGMQGWTADEGRSSIAWFDLVPTPFYDEWKGRLSVAWPPPERSWWRRADRKEMPVVSVLEDSALEGVMPEWDDLVLTWEELSALPTRWQAALKEWRGLYYIVDMSDGKGYVGSAYGGANLLGRWKDYAASGHGGNRLLRQRDARQFRFSILQRVSPDMEAEDVIRLEASWKRRLHTREPGGLNEN